MPMAEGHQRLHLLSPEESLAAQQRQQRLSEHLQKSKASIGAFCPCCYESLTADAVTIFQCRHTYHRQCLLAWFTVSRKQGNCPGCPLCRVACKEEDFFSVHLCSASDPPALAAGNEEDFRLQAKQLRQLLLQEKEDKAATQAALEKAKEELHKLREKAAAAEKQHAAAVSQLSEEVQQAERRLQQQRDEARAREEAQLMGQRLLRGKLQEAEREKQQLLLSKLLLVNNVGLSNEEIQEKMLRLSGLTAEEKLKAQIGTLEFCKRERDRLLADNRIIKEANGMLQRKLMKMKLLLQRLFEANACAPLSTSNTISNNSGSSSGDKSGGNQSIGSSSNKQHRSATPAHTGERPSKPVKEQLLRHASGKRSSISSGDQIAAPADVWSSVGLHEGLHSAAASVKKKRGRHSRNSSNGRSYSSRTTSSSSTCNSGSNNESCRGKSGSSSCDNGSHGGDNGSCGRHRLSSACSREGSTTKSSSSAGRCTSSGPHANSSSSEEVASDGNNTKRTPLWNSNCDDSSTSSSNKGSVRSSSSSTEKAIGSWVLQHTRERVLRGCAEIVEETAAARTPLWCSRGQRVQGESAAAENDRREEQEVECEPEGPKAGDDRAAPKKGADGMGQELDNVADHVSNNRPHTAAAAAAASCRRGRRVSQVQSGDGSIHCLIDLGEQSPTSSKRSSSRTSSKAEGDETEAGGVQEDDAKQKNTHSRATRRHATVEAPGSHAALLDGEEGDPEECPEGSALEDVGSSLSASADVASGVCRQAAVCDEAGNSAPRRGAAAALTCPWAAGEHCSALSPVGSGAAPRSPLSMPSVTTLREAAPSLSSPASAFTAASSVEASPSVAAEISSPAKVSAASAVPAGGAACSFVFHSPVSSAAVFSSTTDVGTAFRPATSVASTPGTTPCADASSSAAAAAAAACAVSSASPPVEPAASSAPAAAVSAAAASTSAACPVVSTRGPSSSSSFCSSSSTSPSYPPRSFIPASLLAIATSTAQQQETELLQPCDTSCEQHANVPEQQGQEIQEAQHRQQQQQQERHAVSRQTALQQVQSRGRRDSLQVVEQQQQQTRETQIALRAPPCATALAAAQLCSASSGTMEESGVLAAASCQESQPTAAIVPVAGGRRRDNVVNAEKRKHQRHLGCLLSRRQTAAKRATRRGLPQSIFPPQAFSLRLTQGRGASQTGSLCNTVFRSSYASLSRRSALHQTGRTPSAIATPTATPASSVVAEISAPSLPSPTATKAAAESVEKTPAPHGATAKATAAAVAVDVPTASATTAAVAQTRATGNPVREAVARCAPGAAAATRVPVSVAEATSIVARPALAAVDRPSRRERSSRGAATATSECLSAHKGILHRENHSANSVHSFQPVRNPAASTLSPSHSCADASVPFAVTGAVTLTSASSATTSANSPACVVRSLPASSFASTSSRGCRSPCPNSPLRSPCFVSLFSSSCLASAGASPTSAPPLPCSTAASPRSASSAAAASEEERYQLHKDSAMLRARPAASAVQPDSLHLRRRTLPVWSSSPCSESSNAPSHSSFPVSSSCPTVTAAAPCVGAQASTHRAIQSPLRGRTEGSSRCSVRVCSLLPGSAAASDSDSPSVHNEEAEEEAVEGVHISCGSGTGNSLQSHSSTKDKRICSSTSISWCSSRCSSRKNNTDGSTTMKLRLHTSSSSSCRGANSSDVATGSNSDSTVPEGESVDDTFSPVVSASAAASVGDFRTTRNLHSSNRRCVDSSSSVRECSSRERTGARLRDRTASAFPEPAAPSARDSHAAERGADSVEAVEFTPADSAAAPSGEKRLSAASHGAPAPDKMASLTGCAAAAAEGKKSSDSRLAAAAKGTDHPCATSAASAATEGHSSSTCRGSTARKAKEGWGCLQTAWKPGIRPGGKETTHHPPPASAARRKKKAMRRHLPFR